MANVVARYQWPEPKFGGLRNSFLHLLLRDPLNNEAPDLLVPTSVVFEAGFPRFHFQYDPATREIRRETSGTLLQAAALFQGILDSIQQFKLYLSALDKQRVRNKKYQQSKLRKGNNNNNTINNNAKVSSSNEPNQNTHAPSLQRDANPPVEDEAKFKERDHEQFLLDLLGDGLGGNDQSDSPTSPLSASGHNNNNINSKFSAGDDEDDNERKRKAQARDIVAMLIYALPDDHAEPEHNIAGNTGSDAANTNTTKRRREHSSSASAGRVTRMEPLTVDTLRRFLLETTPSDPRRQHAVLQQVLPPDEANFTVSRVAWSPAVCLVSRRQSTHPFHDVRHSPAQRTLLFDALQEHSVEVHCAAKTGAEIEAACQGVADHIRRGSGLEVTDMLLYMMTSAGGRQVLLWAGGFDACEKEQMKQMQLLRQQQQQQQVAKSGPETNGSKEHSPTKSVGGMAKLPRSALEGGTVELCDPNEKAETDELNRLSMLESALHREFRGKSTSNKKNDTNNSSPSPSKKRQLGFEEQNTSPTAAAAARINKVSHNNNSNNNNNNNNNATTTQNNNGLAILEQRVNNLFTSGWRSLSDKIPQSEETIRMAEHEIRLVVGSALYDYFSSLATHLQQQQQPQWNEQLFLVVDSGHLENIDVLLSSSTNNKGNNDGVAKRNDLFRSIGFEEKEDNATTVGRKKKQVVDVAPSSAHRAVSVESDNDASYEDDFVDDIDEEIKDNNNNNKMKAVEQEKITTRKKEEVRFRVIPTQHQRHPLTLHVANSLLEVWLGNYVSVAMESLRQSYAKKIREEATRMALGL